MVRSSNDFYLFLTFIGNINRYRLWRRENEAIIGVSIWLCLYFYWGNHRYISYRGAKCTLEKEKLLMKSLPIKISFKIQIERGGDRLSYAKIPL